MIFRLMAGIDDAAVRDFRRRANYRSIDTVCDGPD